MNMEEAKLEQMLWDIERDNVSGSVTMARKAATLVEAAARLAEAGERDLQEEVDRWATAAAKAHPFMALVRTVGRRAINASSADDIAARMERLLWEMENANSRIGEATSSLFPEGGTFMTNSFSGTVHTALDHMASSGRDIRAIVVESRPAREGVQLARALGELGVPSTLIVDAGVASFMPRARAVLVGGDTVAGGFFVNKLGTHPLVLTARAQGVPVYLLSSVLKLTPDHEVPASEGPRSPDEVEADPMRNVTVENIYFERVPLELVTGIVTEDGVLSPDEIGRRVASL